MFLFSELIILFSSAFISSTLFPGGSELLFIYYMRNNPDTVWTYFFAVTLGNSLGAIFTYFMGFYFHWGRNQTQQKYKKATLFCQRYGVYSLFFSFLPIVGDLLPLAAGWLKLSVLKCLLFIVSGKALRYLLIVASVLYFI